MQPAIVAIIHIMLTSFPAELAVGWVLLLLWRQSLASPAECLHGLARSSWTSSLSVACFGLLLLCGARTYTIPSGLGLYSMKLHGLSFLTPPDFKHVLR